MQIPAYKDEEATIVKGIHEPIISEELFEEVQDFLNGKRRKHGYKARARDEFPLRGFLKCPECGNKLTGSASRGGSGIKHFYYHCTKGCPARIKAHIVNDSFSDYLNSLKFRGSVEGLYDTIVKEVFTANKAEKGQISKAVQGEIDKNKERINKAQKMMLDGDITPAEYKEIKANLEPQIDQLLQQQLNSNLNEFEYRQYLKKGLKAIENLAHLFDNAEVKRKQNLIRSIFSENLEFFESKVRTGKLNKLIELSLATGAESGGNKKRTTAKILPLSAGEVPSGFILKIHRNSGNLFKLATMPNFIGEFTNLKLNKVNFKFLQ